MAIPKEPRQLMINLMYLVLTALLALNVSNEILNAFKTLSSSIDKSNESIDAKVRSVYEAIKASEKEKGQEEKVKPYRIKADEVVKKSQELVDYLANWKKRIVVEAGGFGKIGSVLEPSDTAYPQRLDNIDATTLLLVEKKGGDSVKAKILEFRKYLIGVVKEADSKDLDTATFSKLMPLSITTPPKTDHNPTRDWSIANFEHMPAVAAMALFSKMQNDVRSSEEMVIKLLGALAHSKDLKYDTVAAVAVPKTTYALEGDKIEATILLAAYNTNNQPTVSISQGGGDKKPAKGGVIEWSTTAHGTGLQTVKGNITLETAERGTISRPWSFEYMVGQTGASVGLDKMNVMYIGVPNPVSVTAAGYAIGDVYLNVPGGVKQSGENGHFVVEVSQVSQNMTIEIMAKPKTKDGAPVKVGTSSFRVQMIPNPTLYLMGKRENLSAAEMRAAIGPIAKLENFPYDAKFKITELQFSMLPKGGEYKGPYKVSGDQGVKFTSNKDVEELMKRAKPGDRVFIESIKGVGPDNKLRNLGSMIFTLN